MSLHKEIRTKRLIKGYSQSYMAFCLNISQNSYSKLELGQVELTVSRLIEIAEILQLDPTNLVELAVSSKFPTN